MGSCVGSNVLDDDDHRHFVKCLQQFQVPMPYQDDFKIFQTLETLEVLTHKQQNYQVLITKLSGSQVHMKEFIDDWKNKYQQHNHPNLLAVHCISIEEGNRLFVPYSQITLIVDYPIIPISRHKKLISKEGLNEQDMWFLLDCIVGGLRFMQEQKIYPSCLEIDDIVQVNTPFGIQIYKLVDRYFRPRRVNMFHKLVTVDKENPAFLDLKKQALLSPIQIQAIPKKDKYIKQNRYKSDVFNFGIMCLQLIYAKKLEIYDWRNWKVDAQAVKDIIDGLVKRNFSEIMRQLFEQMLHIEEEFRCDFVELDNQLSKLFDSLLRKQRLLQIYPEGKRDQFYLQSTIKLQSHLDSMFKANQVEEVQPIHIQKSSNLLKTQKNVVLENSFDAFKEQIRDKERAKEKEQEREKEKEKEKEREKEQSFMQTHGTLTYTNGHYYQGDIVNKQRQGRGIFYDRNHNKIIEGQWSQDRPDGEVIMYNQPPTSNEVYSHQNVGRGDWIQFKGQVRLGVKEGMGALFFKDGSKYIGQFHNDKAHGRGMFEYHNKETVVGNWEYDQFIA